MTVSPALRSKLDAVKGFPVSAQESLDIEMARYCLALEATLQRIQDAGTALARKHMLLTESEIAALRDGHA